MGVAWRHFLVDGRERLEQHAREWADLPLVSCDPVMDDHAIEIHNLHLYYDGLVTDLKNAEYQFRCEAEAIAGIKDYLILLESTKRLGNAATRIAHWRAELDGEEDAEV